jgi:EAL and modified HD-GYP domain-containing signal transduction protein
VTSAPPFWLGRQPILDRSGTTVAYELLFRSGEANAATIPDNRTATARVISHAFGELGLASVLGDRRGFINFDAELLTSDVVELLPPDRTVIEILETVTITTAVVARCRELHERGFVFALDDIVQLDEAHAPLLPFVEVIKIDVLGLEREALTQLVRKGRAGRRRIQLLAEKVDTHEQAELCRSLGFDLFQGYFFARPIVITGRRADPSKRQLMRLLEQTLDDGDNAAIQETFKEAPELSYKLVRLVNSVGIGARTPIQSLSHALVILGRRQLQRWLQVLLFAHQSTGEFPSPLLQMAAARGKLMELLAAETSSDARWCDQAFMTGILSLLDTLLEMPMSAVIEHLRLPDEVRRALLDRGGRLGHLLRIVEALEQTNDRGVSELLAEGDPCSTGELPQLQIAALTWSNALGREPER